MEYEELKKFYSENFSIGFLGNDISNKFALISLVCYLKRKLIEKNPNISHWSILYKIGKNNIPEKFLKRLAIICEDFSYGCTEFPTFNLNDKDIPAKVKELLNMHLPF